MCACSPLMSMIVVTIRTLLSDDEDEVVIIEKSSGSHMSILPLSNSQKAKRARSRSRSITPPPQLNFLQIQNARNLVRYGLTYLPCTSLCLNYRFVAKLSKRKPEPRRRLYIHLTTPRTPSSLTPSLPP